MTRVSIDVSSVPKNPAGAGIYVVEVVKRLVAFDDLDVVIVARRNDEQRWQRIAPHSEVLGVAPNSRPLRLVWEQLKLGAILGEAAPDVHLGPHYTIPESAKVPKIATIHDTTFFDHPEWHEKVKVPVFRRAIKSAVSKADAMIAVSDDTSRRLQARFGKLDVITIPLGVDHDRFNTHETSSANDIELLARHRIPHRYIAFVGTIEPRKDIPTLVGAFDTLADTDAGLSLVIAGGKGWATDSFLAAVANARHRDRIIQLGYVEADVVPALLRRAAAVAYPSLAEGFGLPALEALACGAALVTTRDTPMADLAQDAALLIDAGNQEQLAVALGRLVRGGADVDRLRRRGPQVAELYTWDATATAHADLFRRFG